MRFLIIPASLFLFSCQGLLPPIWPGNNIPPINISGPTPPSLPTSPISLAPTTGIGVIKCQHANQTDSFNKNLRALLSTNINPQEIVGNHACTKERPGGVFFRGQVITSKPFEPNGFNQDLIIEPENSYIEFHFETFSPNTRNIAPIVLKYTYGTVQEQQVFLTFEDNKGEIHLDGQITHKNGQTLLTGIVRFKNYQTWEGKSPGYSGVLGDFAIKACDFFKC